MTDEMDADYLTVHDAIGVKIGESLNDAALRTMRGNHTLSVGLIEPRHRWKIAAELLRSGSGWARVKRAAKVARRLQREKGGR